MSDDDKYFILTDSKGKETKRIHKDSPEGERLAQKIKEQVAIQKIVDADEDRNPFFL